MAVAGTVTTDNSTLTIAELTATVELDPTAQPPADSYIVNGKATYTNGEAHAYDVTLTDVAADFQCLFPWAGTITVVSADPAYEATLDFGSGTCDTVVTVTIGAMTKEIDLAEWLDNG